MTDTAQHAKSDAKLCTGCGAAFDEADDTGYSQCNSCRTPADAEPVVEVSPPPVPEVTTAPDAGVVPLHLDIEKRKPPPPEDRDYYWLGVTDDCPRAFVAAGGVQFQRKHGKVEDVTGEGKMVYRDNIGRGCIHWLTKAHVARILEEVALKVFRKYEVVTADQFGNKKKVPAYSGRLLSMKPHPTHPFTPQDDDRPLGEFLYMIKVRHKNDTHPMDNPPTLVPR